MERTKNLVLLRQYHGFRPSCQAVNDETISSAFMKPCRRRDPRFASYDSQAVPELVVTEIKTLRSILERPQRFDLEPGEKEASREHVPFTL